jgi:hypothetical protein
MKRDTLSPGTRLSWEPLARCPLLVARRQTRSWETTAERACHVERTSVEPMVNA